jgi:hypothetical protein
LRFTFTLLDPENDERPFEMLLFVDDAYHLESCRPSLSASTTNTLLEALNTSNNLSRFVVEMRKAFKRLIAK